MLRIYFLQHGFNLSNAAAEEVVYDLRAMHEFWAIDSGQDAAPHETTICKLRHPMERHNLGHQLFHLVNGYLKENGLKVSRDTIVDAMIINMSSSTRSKEGVKTKNVTPRCIRHASAISGTLA